MGKQETEQAVGCGAFVIALGAIVWVFGPVFRAIDDFSCTPPRAAEHVEASAAPSAPALANDPATRVCRRIIECGWKVVPIADCLRWTQNERCDAATLERLDAEMAGIRCPDIARIPSRKNECVRF